MDRLQIPPIRTPLTGSDPSTLAFKEWYFYWQRTADQVNQLMIDVDALKGGSENIPDASGPVTGFITAHEVGTRYAHDPDRLVHMTVGFTPIVPTPQSVTYLVSSDNGATWVWIGSQRMLKEGQELKVDRLAPGQNETWKVAAVAGNLGGDPNPLPDSKLDELYPGVQRSLGFPVAGLATPPANQGITATIGTCSNHITADGFTQYGIIPGVIYTDPTSSIDYFVRITVQDLDASKNPIGPEQAHGGSAITHSTHTLNDLQVTYIPGLAFERYRFYVANRNSQSEGDFVDPVSNTLQMVIYNGTPAADHWDVPITIPPFVPPDGGGDVFNVTSVTASEVGPKYQDEVTNLHTVIGVIPVIDVDYSTPRTVTIWFERGDGIQVWQGWYALEVAGEVVRIGDPTLGTEGIRKSGDIYAPTNPAYGTWHVWCAAGRIDKGIDPTSYATSAFTVAPVGACSPTGTTDAHFVADPSTGNVITYSKYYPGVWRWEYYQLTWSPPTLEVEPNYWFTLVTVQKGATISGVWTPAPDREGVNADPTLHFLGRVHAEVLQTPGLSPTQVSVMNKFGAHPATWDIPPLQNDDFSTNVYREFRFLLYNVSRLGTDASGGAGTFTLQTTCWPGGTDHFILIPDANPGSFDVRAANPATIALPLKGGNGEALTIKDGSITDTYLHDQAVTADKMAQDAVTAANKALAADSIVDVNVHDVNISKFTAGTNIFTGDVILSRGISKPVMVLQNDAIYLFGQADASTGASGLTSKPYVGVKNSSIGLFQGGAAGGSVFLDGPSNAITIYAKNADTTLPYFTVTSTGLTLVNGVNSFAVNSNSMAFVDKGLGNRIDTSSAGITLAHGLNPDGTVASTANKLVISANQMQFMAAGSSRVTIDTTGGAGSITLSNGGAASVTVTASTVAIVNGDLSIASGTVTIDIDATNYIRAHNSSSSVTCQMTGDNVRVTRAIAGNPTATLGPAILTLQGAAGNTLTVTAGGITMDPNDSLGTRTVIDANMVYIQSVQTTGFVFGGQFGILVNPAVPTDPGNKMGASGTFTAGTKTVTVTGGLVTSIV